MKAKTIDIVNAYALINGAEISKIEDKKTMYAAVRALKALRKPADEYNEFIKSAVAKMRPKDYDNVEAVLNEPEKHTPEEVRKARKAEADFAKAIEECVKPEADKEVELDFPPMTEEQICGLIAVSEWNGAQSVLVDSVIGE